MMFCNEIFGVFLFNKEIKNTLFCYLYDFNINFYWRGVLTESESCVINSLSVWVLV